MTRSQRLLELIQILRRKRRPVSGAQLAEELGISLRTLYRDIATLQQQGANIEGEAGMGYVLRPGFLLPPLMFTEEELEALVLGARWVVRRTDDDLAMAARNVLVKISDILPDELKKKFENVGLVIGPEEIETVSLVPLPQIREAIRWERKVHLIYCDADGQESHRTIWPIALGFFNHAYVLVAWCELRSDFRHFRVDRMESFTLSEEKYPQSRQSLFKAWRDDQGMDDEQAEMFL